MKKQNILIVGISIFLISVITFQSAQSVSISMPIRAFFPPELIVGKPEGLLEDGFGKVFQDYYFPIGIKAAVPEGSITSSCKILVTGTDEGNLTFQINSELSEIIKEFNEFKDMIGPISFKNEAVYTLTFVLQCAYGGEVIQNSRENRISIETLSLSNFKIIKLMSEQIKNQKEDNARLFTVSILAIILTSIIPVITALIISRTSPKGILDRLDKLIELKKSRKRRKKRKRKK